MNDIISTQGYYGGVLVVRVINAVVIVMEIVLTTRIVLEFFGASVSSQFVAWIYSLSNTMIAPFVGSFAGFSIEGTGVIDFVAILAMIGYAILGWLVLRLLRLVFSSVY